MIPREAYRGPLTKSAQAMFDRADRRRGVVVPAPPARRRGPAKDRGRSDAERALAVIGMNRARLRQWEDFGLIALQRGAGGHRVVDAQVIEHLRTICALRSLGLSLRQIAWLSRDGPPTLEILRRQVSKLRGQAQGGGERFCRPPATAARGPGDLGARL